MQDVNKNSTKASNKVIENARPNLNIVKQFVPIYITLKKIK